ncbi:hypothetical protein AVEN_158014-1 [Araneus ventricosus]|uniref:Uncharacterized protein n=1 Tax=Araneus ventricosus TaxID=182803 RepID=A0A4Y2Q185_ARAVE|nr:hypothetical protein AVEN_158014-1 [Araneus ventricosus]
MFAAWQMAWDDGDTGRLIHNIIPTVSLQPINWTLNEVLFFTGESLPFVSPKIQPCRNLILFLLGNRHTNPLCYGLPSHNFLPYGSTQPTTSASMVRQSSQQFNVKKEDPYFAPLSAKRNQTFPFRSKLIVFSSLQYSSQLSPMLLCHSHNLGQHFQK